MLLNLLQWKATTVDAKAKRALREKWLKSMAPKLAFPTCPEAPLSQFDSSNDLVSSSIYSFSLVYSALSDSALRAHLGVLHHSSVKIVTSKWYHLASYIILLFLVRFTKWFCATHPYFSYTPRYSSTKTKLLTYDGEKLVTPHFRFSSLTVWACFPPLNSC